MPSTGPFHYFHFRLLRTKSVTHKELSGRAGNIFPLSCDLGSQREADNLMFLVLPDAQSCVQSASASGL